MKTAKIILTAMLALMSGMTAMAEVVNPCIGTRVDYINAKGERFYSRTVNDLKNQDLFSISNSEDGWKVSNWRLNKNSVSSVRFVPWGIETYSVNIESEVPVQYYVKSSKKQKVERLKENSHISFNALCGDTIVFELDLPDKAFPEMDLLYEYSQTRPDGEEFWIDWSDVPLAKFGTNINIEQYTDPDFAKKVAPFLRGNPIFTPLPANDKCNNRWGISWIMENEPMKFKFGYGYADGKLLTRVVQEALYGTLYTWRHYDGSDTGENWIMRYFGEGMSAEQINNLAMEEAKDIPGMNCLLKSDSKFNVIPWAEYYRGIMLSNMLLDDLDLFISATETERDIAKAQLLSLRAHCYTRILQMCGKRWSESENGNTFCAPLILDINDVQKPLATMAEIKRQCENDLNEAIRIFGNANYKQSTLIEPDLNVARGLLMRLALWTNDWQTARDMAKLLVADMPLSTNENMLSGFYNRTDSWIWGVSTYDLNENEAGVTLYFDCPQSFDACNGCYASNYYGASAIDRDLWLKIPETDMRRNLFAMPELLKPLNNIALWYEKRNYSSIERLFLKETYAEKVRSIYQERRPEVNAFKYDNGDDYLTMVEIPYGAQLKFWGTGSRYGYDEDNKDGGTLFMRSDEALLTQAEACWHLGEESTARELLNRLNSIRNEDYNCTATGQDLLDEIRLYRSIELWGEGFSWFDWKRWNLPINRNLWEEGNTSSGNWPGEVTAKVETTAANGWRALIPAYYLKQNPNIDISKMGYTEASGYDNASGNAEASGNEEAFDYDKKLPAAGVTPARLSDKVFRKSPIPSREIPSLMRR